jgi:catechol 2,3-dioxygenase-like lactoylglutathione lyase family enzyme
MTAPHLFRIIVHVNDLDVTAAFYTAVLGMPGERVAKGRHYFHCGSTILVLLDPSGDGEGKRATPLPDHIYFAVDELEPVRALIATHGGRLAPGDVHGDPAGQVARRPWGELSFYAFDPSGNPLCFVQRGSEFLGRPRG